MEGCASQQKRNADRVPLEYSSVKEPLQALVSWIASQLQSSSGTSISLVIPSLMTLMACPEARTMFQNSGGIGYLSRHLRMRPNGSTKRSKALDTGASVQQLYELCFCLWTLTYECSSSAAVRAQFARDGAVSALADLVTTAPREKVVRVAISALANLATCTEKERSVGSSGRKVVNSSYFLTEMIGCGLMKSIDRMKERQWTDPDIIQGKKAAIDGRRWAYIEVSFFDSLLASDLNLLYKLLHENFKEMSRWDVYKAEVESGHLEFGIIHSEKFFKEHAKRMEGKNSDFELLRVRTTLLPLCSYCHISDFSRPVLSCRC